jgi:hypothetical protein
MVNPPNNAFAAAFIENCSTRQGCADELLLRVTEEVSKRHEKTVIAGVVSSPVFALNDPIHIVLRLPLPRPEAPAGDTRPAGA